jgi:hypothetical protein
VGWTDGRGFANYPETPRAVFKDPMALRLFPASMCFVLPTALLSATLMAQPHPASGMGPRDVSAGAGEDQGADETLNMVVKIVGAA